MRATDFEYFVGMLPKTGWYPVAGPKWGDKPALWQSKRMGYRLTFSKCPDDERGPNEDDEWRARLEAGALPPVEVTSFRKMCDLLTSHLQGRVAPTTLF